MLIRECSIAALLSVVLSGCVVPRIAPRIAPRTTYKIALVAPFEGHLRQAGYDAFPAFRLALREQIVAGGTGPYDIEFVAYNDNADPAFAERVAHNVVEDGRVLAVIGHVLTTTSAAAQPVYAEAQLPMVTLAPSTRDAPHCVAQPFVYTGLITPTSEQARQAEQALNHFTEVSGGPAAGADSLQAYLATRLVLQAIADDVAAHGAPTRAGVGQMLSRVAGCAPKQ